MCGIIGIVGRDNVSNLLLDGLKKLEYRGYDSAGIAVLESGDLEILKEEGKITNLEKLIKKNPTNSKIGIGHTRWATHGKPTVDNAHPHFSDKVAIVHNGIIENYQELKNDLLKEGVSFKSETDSEVIVWIITKYLNKGFTPEKAVEKTLKKLRGSYALAMLFTDYPDMLLGAKNGSPLCVGYTKDDGMFLGSDAIALSSLTDTICYLEDGDVIKLDKNKVEIKDKFGRIIHRKIKTVSVAQEIEKNDYEYYMLKEIFEQPKSIEKTLAYLYDKNRNFKEKIPDFSNIKKITLIGCGTAFLAGSVAKYWFEKLCNISVEIDVASEFRYREPYLEKGNVALFLSQSGETADTLAALRYCKEKEQKIISIVNTKGSTIDRESDFSLYTQAGTEIGVASTKAFTAQLLTLISFVIELARSKKLLKDEKALEIIKSLETIPALIKTILKESDKIKTLATEISKSKGVLFLGRGTSFSIAQEGALKLKELSYMYAEAYAAGEMKHGPIALIDEKMPVVVIAPYNKLFEKTVSNIEEVLARKGKVILFSDEKGCDLLKDKVSYSFEIPNSNFYIEPILSAIPMQLLAYHVAYLKGNDIDKPRNLAKSVTVE